MNLFRDDLNCAAEWIIARVRRDGPSTVHVLGNGEILTKLARTDRLPPTSTTYMATYTRKVRYGHLVADLRHFREERIARALPKPLARLGVLPA